MPKVSVVMGVYNGADTLTEALNSLLDQTICDLEVIAIDDGSTDSSQAILRRYAERDSRLRVLVHERNQGLARSLNDGICAASATYIMRADQDDISLSVRAEEQLAVLEAHPDVGLVSSFVDTLFLPSIGEDERIDAWAEERHRRAMWKRPDEIPIALPHRCLFHHGEVMYRKTVWVQAGGYRPPFMMAEDYDLWLRMAQCGTAFRIIPQTLYIRRYRRQNASQVYAALQQFTNLLARECYDIRADGKDDTEYARTRCQAFLTATGLSDRFVL